MLLDQVNCSEPPAANRFFHTAAAKPPDLSGRVHDLRSNRMQMPPPTARVRTVEAQIGGSLQIHPDDAVRRSEDL
jgi:hypothetical protein